MFVFVNGELIPAEQPAISASDRGFTLGDGLFETVKSARGEIRHLTAHLNRLSHGAALLQIPLEPGEIPAAINRTLIANQLEQSTAAVRLTLSRGVAPRGLAYPAQPRPMLVITAQPFTPYPAELYRRGMSAIILPQRRNEFAVTTNIKSLNYLENIIGKNQATAAGADEGIFLNTQGLLAEGCLSNLFWVRDEAIYTPSLECGLIPGIIRQAILDLAQTNGIPVLCGKYKAPALLTAAEAFLTNSLLEIMPLTRVNGQPIGHGEPGQLTRRLAELYRKTAKC